VYFSLNLLNKTFNPSTSVPSSSTVTLLMYIFTKCTGPKFPEFGTGFAGGVGGTNGKGGNGG